MALVREILDWLEQYDPEENLALTGWWRQSDVENNNDVELTKEQWDAIVIEHENDTMRDIDDVVWELVGSAE
jgi:hypothetical protein